MTSWFTVLPFHLITVRVGVPFDFHTLFELWLAKSQTLHLETAYFGQRSSSTGVKLTLPFSSAFLFSFAVKLDGSRQGKVSNSPQHAQAKPRRPVKTHMGKLARTEPKREGKLNDLTRDGCWELGLLLTSAEAQRRTNAYFSYVLTISERQA